MSEPAEDLDGAGLLLELLAEVRAQRAELRALREALGRRGSGGRRVDRSPPSPDPVPEMSDEERQRALRLARELGFAVTKP